MGFSKKRCHPFETEMRFLPYAIHPKFSDTEVLHGRLSLAMEYRK